MAKIQDMLSKPFVHLTAILFITFLIYSNTFHAPFQLDDYGSIIDNNSIGDPHNFLSLKGSRDIGFLTFSLNYKFGGLDVFGYHAVNLLIHMLNAVLVYFLVSLIFQQSAISNQRSAISSHNPSPITHNPLPLTHHPLPIIIPLFAALLFAVHPLQTGAVTYIVQRFTSLATLFYLLAFVAYIKARLVIACNSPSPSPSPARGEGCNISPPLRGEGCNISPPLRGGDEGEGDVCGFTNDRISKKKKAASYIFWLFYFSSIIFAGLAMKTKEIAFTLPLVITLYEFMFFDGNVRKRLLYLIPLLLTMLIIPLSLLNLDKPVGEIIGSVSEVTRDHPDLSRWSYLLTQFRVIVTYLRLLILPINQNFDYDYPVFHSLLNPEVFLSFFFLVSIFALGIYLYRISSITVFGITHHPSRVAAFGIFWFFITLAVESSVMPIKDVIFEHRVYLPSVGAIMAFSAAVFYVLSRKLSGSTAYPLPTVYRLLSTVVIAVVIVVVIALSVAAYQRNAVWKDSVRFWENAVKGSPNKARPHNDLGIAYLEQGRIDEAIHEFITTLKLNPYYDNAYNNLGNAYFAQGRIAEAINEYKIALKFNPDYAAAYTNLGIAYAAHGRIDEAIKEFKTALRINPNMPKAHNSLGDAYFAQGRIAEAINEYNTALAFNPDMPEAHNSLGIAYATQGRIAEAVHEFKTALKFIPDNADVHINLGKAYLAQGSIAEAVNEYRIALKLNPEDAMARKELEALLKK